MPVKGFTLIEVLIALVILSIALTAVIKTTSQNIHNTWYVQNKSVAEWLAQDAFNQVQLGLLKSSSLDTISQSVDALGQQWKVEESFAPSENKQIHTVTVHVYLQPNHQELYQLLGYCNA